jgi:hypothetical protein
MDAEKSGQTLLKVLSFKPDKADCAGNIDISKGVLD